MEDKSLTSCPVSCEFCDAIFTVDEILKKLDDAVKKDLEEINGYIHAYSKKKVDKKKFALLLNSWFQEDRMHPEPILSEYICKLIVKFAMKGIFYEDAMKKYYDVEIADVVDTELCRQVIDLKGNVRCVRSQYWLRSNDKTPIVYNKNKKRKLK